MPQCSQWFSGLAFGETYRDELGRGPFRSSQWVAFLLTFTAERCARLRETLRSQNKRVNSRALDLIIAATALEYDLTLVTENIRDFQDIPDLSVTQPR